DPADRLVAVMRAFALHHAREHTSARVVNYELNSLSPEHLSEIAALRREIKNEMQALIQQGVDAGAFDTSDPPKAAMAVLSLGIDIARWYREDGPWSPDKIADFYADLALRIAEELGVSPRQVGAAVELLDGGATVPFVARYRKEATGGMDDTQLRKL